MSPLRIGLLGAANIAPKSVIEPARNLPDVEVVVEMTLRSLLESYAPTADWIGDADWSGDEAGGRRQ